MWRRSRTGSTCSASEAARERPGTQASFLELFGGDHVKVRELERRVTAKLGFREQFAVTGQTYARKTDSMVLDALSGIAQSASKMAGDLRLLQHEGELLEPFESEQIGSSAMAYKRNPDARRADHRPGTIRHLAAGQRGPHGREPVAGADARRQRQPPPHAAGSVPRRRRHPGAGDEHRGRDSRCARTSFVATSPSRCRSWPPSVGSCSA